MEDYGEESDGWDKEEELQNHEEMKQEGDSPMLFQGTQKSKDNRFAFFTQMDV